jgi:hypothetical protein
MRACFTSKSILVLLLQDEAAMASSKMRLILHTVLVKGMMRIRQKYYKAMFARFIFLLFEMACAE